MRLRTFALIPLLSLVFATPSGRAQQPPLPNPFAGTFTAVPSPAADGAGEPNLATDARGRVWMTWLEPRPGGGHRFRLASLSGSKWSAPATMAEGTNFLANWADFPSLFIARDGTMAAHWLERGEARGSYGIRIRTSSDAGQNWTPSITPHPGSSAGEHGFVSFFEAPGGGIGLVWLDGRDMAAGAHAAAGHAGAMNLRSTVIRKGALGEESIANARVCECCQTSATRAGNAVLVVYRDRSEKEIRDTSLVRFENGTWSEPVTVHPDNWEINGCPVNGPVITAAGNAVAVAWFTGVGNTPKTQVAFSSDTGRTFGSPIRLDAGVTLGRLAMTMPAPDRVLVTSLERASTGARLVLRDVRRDGRISAPVEVTPATPDRSGGFARLALSGKRLVVAWTDVRPSAPATVRTVVAEIK